MKSTTTILVLSLAIAGVASPLAHADGEGCTASQTRQSAIALRQAEDAEKSGRVKDAYTAATRSIPAIDCAVNGNTRRIGLIERTSKRLGDEAEKAGRYGEAFDYYSAPQRHGKPTTTSPTPTARC